MQLTVYTVFGALKSFKTQLNTVLEKKHTCQLKPVLRIRTSFVRIRLQIWILNRKKLNNLNSKFFLSFLNFLFRICFVKIQIVLFHSQFFVSYSELVGYISKNILLAYQISFMFSDFLWSDPDPEPAQDNLTGSRSGQKVRIRPDPVPDLDPAPQH